MLEHGRKNELYPDGTHTENRDSPMQQRSLRITSLRWDFHLIPIAAVMRLLFFNLFILKNKSLAQPTFLSFQNKFCGKTSDGIGGTWLRAFSVVRSIVCWRNGCMVEAGRSAIFVFPCSDYLCLIPIRWIVCGFPRAVISRAAV